MSRPQRDVRPYSEDARVPVVRRAPHPWLRPLLDRDYAAFTDATEPNGGFVLPATAAVRLVVKLQDSALRPPQFVAGAHGSYSIVEGTCAPSYVEIRLAPLGAYRVLGVPLHHLSGRLIDLGDVLGAEARRLGDLLREAPEWGQRFDHLDRLLLRRLETGQAVAPEVARAWRQIVTTGGAASIRDVAMNVGWSNKHLVAKFKEQIGLAPKRAARLIRFQHMLRHIDEQGWPELAAQSGYADQAHLAREFREFTGTSPTRYLGSLQVNSVQDRRVPIPYGRS